MVQYDFLSLLETKEEQSNLMKAFSYNEKWKGIFDWVGQSSFGDRHTYCRTCKTHIFTFHKGIIALKQHTESVTHMEKTSIANEREPSDPLPSGDAALQSVHQNCDEASATGQKESQCLPQCNVGAQNKKDIKTVCQLTPYRLYVREGDAQEKESSVSVFLGSFDVKAAQHNIQFLETLPSADDGKDQTAKAVVETLKKSGLPACNIAAFYASGSKATSHQIYSRLREFNPNIVAFGWMDTIADTACQTGIKALSSQVQELMVDIHAHHSSSTTKNSSVDALMSGICSSSPSFPLNTSCLAFHFFVSKSLEMWQNLILYYKSCDEGDHKAKSIYSRLQEPKVRATFMFLEQALKPLCAFQGVLQTERGGEMVNILLILEEASSLLYTYSSYFLRPQAIFRFLKEHNVQILNNMKFQLPSPEPCLDEKAVEDLNQSGNSDVIELMKQEALAFYVTLTECIAAMLPLNEGLLRAVVQLLDPDNRQKVSGRAVGDLGTGLGICRTPEEAAQLTSEYLKYQIAEAEEGGEAGLVPPSLEEHWASVLKDLKPSSFFRKLVLTLFSFTCPPLECQKILTEVKKKNNKQTNKRKQNSSFSFKICTLFSFVLCVIDAFQ